MTEIALRRTVLLCAVVLVLLVAYPTLATSQSESAKLSNTLRDLQSAESAGATSSEMQPLIERMNSVVVLERQLENLPVQNNVTKTRLLEEINSTLASVDAQAVQLEMTASQRTYVHHVIAYLSGLIGAVIGTIAYYFGLVLYVRYRIKRTFRMRIIPK